MSKIRNPSLVAMDLAMFNNAAFYNLSEKAERLRSVADLERFFFRVAGVVQPELFIEAGARNAVSSIRARRHIADARIVAFEANPLNFNRHAGNPKFKTSKVEYLHQALSDSDGEITFNIQIVKGQESADGQGSILRRNESAEGSKPAKVAATRLDTFFEPKSFSSACIWMDVEGATKEVLLGAEKILPAVKALYVEVEDKQVWDSQWLSGDVSAYLFEHGLVPVARDYQSRYQYNILFLSAESLNDARIRFVLSEHISRVGSMTSLTEGALSAKIDLPISERVRRFKALWRSAT